MHKKCFTFASGQDGGHFNSFSTLGKFNLYNNCAFQKFIIYLDVFFFFFIPVHRGVKSATFPSEVKKV